MPLSGRRFLLAALSVHHVDHLLVAGLLRTPLLRLLVLLPHRQPAVVGAAPVVGLDVGRRGLDDVAIAAADAPGRRRQLRLGRFVRFSLHFGRAALLGVLVDNQVGRE